MKSIHNDTVSYEYDEHGIQGLYRTWYDPLKPEFIAMRKDHAYHGELIRYHYRCRIVQHSYMLEGKIIHDFLANPLSDEERMLLVLKYGAPLLPKDI